MVDHGLAYEAILCLALLAGEIPIDRYEWGVEIRRLWTVVPESSKRSFTALRPGAYHIWVALLGLVRGADEPRDVPGLTRLLRAMDPVDVKLAALGFHTPEMRAVVEAGVYRAAATGDADAIRQFARETKLVHGGPGYARLMKTPARELVDEIVECLLGVSERMHDTEPAWYELLARSAGEASRVGARGDGKAVVETMTHGLVYNGDVGIGEVLVVPSLVHRPFTIISDHDATKIFCYAADPQPAGEETPDAHLVAVYRALGDQTRLRILKRLQHGSTSVGQLSEELGLAKSTVHQHLFGLRTAGLVRLDLKTGYELAELPDLSKLLKDYLGAPSARRRK